ncbi:MAG: hypothetical protein AB1439_03900 [candidate division FCPU426 bacterium]
MRLTEIFQQLKGLEIFEERSATDELIDVVFENRISAAWQERLESILGPALKPQGQKADGQASKLTKAFGGIRPEQTLFYKNFGEYAVMAMLWPWGNGRCTSCKMFRVAPLESDQNSSLFSRWFKK